MGHNSVVPGHPKSTEIPRVDRLSTGPSIWGVTIPKSIISSFIEVAIFFPLCGVFIILNEIILLFNIHSLSI